MISAADYWSIVVRPSLDEFFAKNGDLRLAMHAATDLTHAVDYVFQNRNMGNNQADRAIQKYRVDFASRCFSFRVVEGFAMASKHCNLDRKNLKNFSSDRHSRFYPAIFGKTMFGRSFFGDTVGGIAVRWTDHGFVNLTNAIRTSAAEMERELPDLVGRSSGPPDPRITDP